MKKYLLVFLILFISQIGYSQTADEYYKKGLEEVNLNNPNYDLAIDYFNRALEVEPNGKQSFDILTFRGFCQYQKNELVLAENDFDKAITLNPNYFRVYRYKSYISQEKKIYKSEIEFLSKAIELNSNDTLSYLNRGQAYLNISNSIDAIKDFNKAINLNSIEAETYLIRGKALLSIQQYSEAIKDFESALDLNSNLESAKQLISETNNKIKNQKYINSILADWKELKEKYESNIKSNNLERSVCENMSSDYHEICDKLYIGIKNGVLKSYLLLAEINLFFIDNYEEQKTFRLPCISQYHSTLISELDQTFFYDKNGGTTSPEIGINRFGSNLEFLVTCIKILDHPNSNSFEDNEYPEKLNKRYLRKLPIYNKIIEIEKNNVSSISKARIANSCLEIARVKRKYNKYNDKFSIDEIFKDYNNAQEFYYDSNIVSEINEIKILIDEREQRIRDKKIAEERRIENIRIEKQNRENQKVAEEKLAKIKKENDYIQAYREGLELLNNSNFDLAIEKFSFTKNLYPSDAKSALNLAIACLKLKNYTCAKAQFEEAFKLNPELYNDVKNKKDMDLATKMYNSPKEIKKREEEERKRNIEAQIADERKREEYRIAEDRKKEEANRKYNWQCIKCAKLFTLNRMPSKEGCKGEMFGHKWESLGEFGQDSYSCSKCGIDVMSKWVPVKLAGHCGDGFGGHKWFQQN